eukprot:TRINITY_DN492_c0_g1_i3.p1 TRINITY_DN492_c0_g1~~TRINITY_DN492_c0_g1_i3.p1  ORF type:complete len:1204 (-),score=155.21 TRINITY_DN492_c0_g1_i3:35-3646(-)
MLRAELSDCSQEFSTHDNRFLFQFIVRREYDRLRRELRDDSSRLNKHFYPEKIAGTEFVMQPLHAAALLGDKESVSILLEFGADQTARCWNGLPLGQGAQNSLLPADCAQLGGDSGCIRLLSSAAPAQAQAQTSQSRSESKEGILKDLAACSSDYSESDNRFIFQFLVRRDMDRFREELRKKPRLANQHFYPVTPNSTDHRIYILHAAAILGNADAVRALLQHDPGRSTRSWNGLRLGSGAADSLTESDYARLGGDQEVMQLLGGRPTRAPDGGCLATCTMAHSRHGNCLRCGKDWGPHSGHNCPDGSRGSWIVPTPGSTFSGGCSSTCTTSHRRDGNCLRCGKDWGPHSGHDCEDGSRGSWVVGGRRADGCQAGCRLSHEDEGPCLRCGEDWGPHSGHDCPRGGVGSWPLRGSAGSTTGRAGCGSDCRLTHSSHGLCLVCGDDWGRHAGHRCRDGRTGSWPVDSPSEGCQRGCSESHDDDGACLVCGADWGPHSGHRCPDGRTGSWRVASAAPTGPGCSSSCTRNHTADGPCLRCRLGWGPHNGHRCPSGGRGSWVVKERPPSPPTPQIASDHPVRQFAECPVCFEVFKSDGRRRPLLLSKCAHTLCADCATKVVRGRSVVCPECRQSTDLPGGNIDALPPNRMLLSMIESAVRAGSPKPTGDADAKVAEDDKPEVQAASASGSVIPTVSAPSAGLCLECERSAATVFCSGCDADFCDRCAERVHGRALARHKSLWTPVTVKPLSAARCLVHKSNSVDRYCKQCSKWTCTECTGHADHAAELVDLETGVGLQRQRIIELKKQVADAQQACSALLVVATDRGRAIDRQSSKARRRIIRARNRLTERVRQRAAALLQQAVAAAAQSQAAVTERRAQVTSTVSQLSDADQQLHRLHEMTDFRIISNAEQIDAQLQATTPLIQAASALAIQPESEIGLRLNLTAPTALLASQLEGMGSVVSGIGADPSMPNDMDDGELSDNADTEGSQQQDPDEAEASGSESSSGSDPDSVPQSPRRSPRRSPRPSSAEPDTRSTTRFTFAPPLARNQLWTLSASRRGATALSGGSNCTNFAMAEQDLPAGPRPRYSVRVSGPFVVIGLVSTRHLPLLENPSSGNICTSPNCGWYIHKGGYRLPRSSEQHVPGWRSGNIPDDSIVTVEVDVAARTIAFLIDGVSTGPAYQNIPTDSPLRPVILFEGLPETATFVDQ